MIVVAIVGVLAAVATSVYPAYLVRSKVTEGLSLAEGAKTSVAENASAALPFANGWIAPAPTSYVAAVAIDAVTGEITITYTADAGNGTLVLAPRDGGPGGAALAAGVIPASNVTWNCNSVGSSKAGAKGTLIDKYAPMTCRT